MTCLAPFIFLLKCLLPALGYEMEKVGLFSFTPEQLYGHVEWDALHFHPVPLY